MSVPSPSPSPSSSSSVPLSPAVLSSLFPPVFSSSLSDSYIDSLSSSVCSLVSSHYSSLRYSDFSFLRHWLVSLRSRYCPASSYDAGSRCSLGLLIATGGLGIEAAAFAVQKDFSPIFTCECDQARIDACFHHLTFCGLHSAVQLKHYSAMQFVREKFDRNCPGAIIYWDLGIAIDSQTTVKLNAAMDDYVIESAEASSPRSLTELVQSIFRSTSCCLICLRVAEEFQPQRLAPLTRVLQTSDEIKPPTPGSGKWLALCGKPLPSASAANLPPTVQAASSSSGASSAPIQIALPHSDSVYSDPLVVPCSSGYQLQFLHHSASRPSDSHLHQRLRQILNSQLYNCPIAQENLLREFTRLVQSRRPTNTPAPALPVRPAQWSDWRQFVAVCQSNGFLQDEELYDQLRHYFHSVIKVSAEVQQVKAKSAAGEDGRANSRVSEIVNLIHSQDRPNIRSMLDVGCSEGSITAALGAALHLDRPNIHGCDVRAIAGTDFTFHLVVDERLPFEDQSFDLVTALMALHHITDVKKSIAEIGRVLRPGGLLIIREHDYYCDRLPVLIDVLHGLYARVWSDPPEQPTFCDNYFAHYRSRSEWRDLLEAGGLLRQAESSPDSDRHYRPPMPANRFRAGQFIKNPFAYYYGVYVKKGHSSVSAPKRALEQEPADEQRGKRARPLSDLHRPDQRL